MRVNDVFISGLNEHMRQGDKRVLKSSGFRNSLPLWSASAGAQSSLAI